MISNSSDIDLSQLKPSKEEMTKRVLDLHQEINDYLSTQGYQLTSDLSNVTSKAHDITYICACGNELTKRFKDLIRRGCRYCNNKILKEVPTDYSICPNDDKEEKWAAIEGGFISSKGRAINSHGKNLSKDERGRYFLAGKLQYVQVLMAKGFNIENANKLTGQKSNLVVRSVNKQELILENIYIGTRNEVGKENGKKSRQSMEFKENNKKSLYQHMNKFKNKTITELNNFVLFEDGSIYNDNEGQGGKRFLTFSKTSSLYKSNQYYTLCTDDKSYYVHRLICYTFKPIEGFNKLEDYKDYEVNHIDGNTLNNHIDNLEWVTHSSNMAHAYDEKLNRKLRPVLQYRLNPDGTQGDFIAEFESIAQASRDLNIPEHRIRECAKNRSQPKDYIWRYKNEEENSEWSKKFSSKS